MDAPEKKSTVVDIQFLANTIHELRTPIQTISGSLELLNETLLSEEQFDFVQQIRFSSDVLLTLVNDMLDFSKINSGMFALDSVPISPVEITEQTAELLAPEAHNRNLELITDIDFTIPTAILGDPIRIKQVLMNLIKNAIKFTPSGYIHVKLSQKNNQTLLFEVKDSGIGIPKNMQDKVFTDFFQVDSSANRQYGGTGLGLPISKNLIEAMGGTIGVKSEEKKGSTFWFSIPLIIDTESSPRFLIEDKIKLVSQLDIPEYTSILLVDDQKLSAKSLRSKLMTLKLHNIEEVDSEKKTLQKLEKAVSKGNPFTIVFINMTMKNADYWNLAKAIRNNPLLHKTKCFLIIPEGKIESNLKKRVFKYFEDYIYKPIKFSSLTELLSNCFSVPSNFGIIDSVEELPKTQIAQATTSSFLARGKTILIAEDHPINQKLLEIFISQLGATTITASNGQEAIDHINGSSSIDVVFMDIHMPIVSGVEASMAIRKSGFTMPIIACTANNDTEDFKIFEESGINDVLIKPFKKQDVANILAKHIVLDGDSELKTSAASFIKTLLGKTESLDFWDWNDFMDTVGGDISLGKELIIQYIEQTAKFLVLAERAERSKDFKSLVSIGHTLKGSSATLSLGNLTKIGAAIERAGKNKDVQTVKMGLKTFNEIFSNFKQFVEP